MHVLQTKVVRRVAAWRHAAAWAYFEAILIIEVVGPGRLQCIPESKDGGRTCASGIFPFHFGEQPEGAARTASEPEGKISGIVPAYLFDWKQ
ncbi:MAG: hypothetical protein JWO08_3913 [Verrucomicrobiaceae bacterium]|nr:hypothetical protein [Verrucomicrobiaceae bacterium]